MTVIFQIMAFQTDLVSALAQKLGVVGGVRRMTGPTLSFSHGSMELGAIRFDRGSLGKLVTAAAQARATLL
jgi:hypothetical protein